MNRFKGKEPVREEEEQKQSLDNNGQVQENIIRGTQRSDGSFRKDIKIREGFVNTFVAERYKIPQRRGEGGEVNKGIDIKSNWRSHANEPTKHTDNESNLGWRNSNFKDQQNGNRKNQEKQVVEKFNSIDNEFPNLVDDNKIEANHGQISNSAIKQQPEKVQKADTQTTHNLNFIPFSNAAKEKELKKLSKKLREIEVLEQRLSKGLELQPEAIEKVSKKDDIVKMFEKLSLQDSEGA